MLARTAEFIRALRDQGGRQAGCPACGGHLVRAYCEDCGTDFNDAAH